MKLRITLAVVATLCVSSIAFATQNRFHQFNTDVQNAYAKYRVALFQTNKKDLEKSMMVIELFQQDWQLLIENYGNVPPEVFNSDPEWGVTLKSINDIAENSSRLLQQNELSQAHETLEAIRDLLSSLRHRNSVIVFSDHINNYHEVMESLLLAGYTPDKLDTKAVNHIRGELAVLKYLAATIKENTPHEYDDNAQYQKLIRDLFRSLEELEMAINQNAPEMINKAVKGLKPAYAKLFLNFG